MQLSLCVNSRESTGLCQKLVNKMKREPSVETKTNCIFTGIMYFIDFPTWRYKGGSESEYKSASFLCKHFKTFYHHLCQTLTFAPSSAVVYNSDIY